jgi:hypothetical protein
MGKRQVNMEYQGKPFQDSVYPGGPQIIPGRIMCAYYDFGGEGVAYHDSDEVNHGSGELNPADGSYLHEFRKTETVDITYTKDGEYDNHPYNFIEPELGMLYVGWTVPGEWVKYTVEVKQTGLYTVHLFYTSNKGGEIAISVNDCDVTGPIQIQTTYRNDDPLEWRQWHHWNKLNGIARLHLEQGLQVLTLHTVSNGGMNYAYLDFELL